MQRKGFGSRKGSPDIIVWIRFYYVNSRIYWQIPLLVELESTFENALIDFKKFADRSYDDPDKITIPIIVRSTVLFKHELCRADVNYIVRETSLYACGLNESSGEHELLEKIKDWANDFQKYISIRNCYRRFGELLSQFSFDLRMFGIVLRGDLPLILLDEVKDHDVHMMLQRDVIRVPALVVTKRFQGKEKVQHHPTWVKIIWLSLNSP